MSKLKMTMMIAVAAFDMMVCAAHLRGADATPAPGERYHLDAKIRGEMLAGIAGDSNALKAGLSDCEAVLAANPRAAEALVWHGSATMYSSKTHFQTGDMQGGNVLFTKGLEELNNASAMEPDNPTVLGVRGATLLKASAAMPASDQSNELLREGLADSIKTYNEIKPHFASEPLDIRGRMLTGIADGYDRTGDAQNAATFYKLASSELKGTEWAAAADRWLQSHPQ